MVKITKKQAELYHVRQEGFEGWADIVLICGEQSVSVMIRSDYGSFDHHWSHCGYDPKEFLSNCEFEYAMNKLCDDFLVLDQSGCETAIKQAIIERRRIGQIDKHTAREAWESMPELAYASTDKNTYTNMVYMHDSFDDIFDEYDEMPRDTKPSPSCQDFWNECWLPFIEQLKSERSAVAA
ncbi:hypothetical protein NFHSH190041_20120 [Shewanella sp. NFH-SH190041]|uniref:hypothetical protein n=1 Tax=Shewanella sp. NFH-SH190041 TaxID=2950245 RepID=UPI0021C39DC3|nr:hypothetical protein [Shewanella sp. NFH-SH190041]BDM64560.1 hypothetical protein NFHSH190041_20120 [Shewanella sp. NFH-SH190041]